MITRYLLFIVAVHIPAEAQVKNINITVRRAEDLNSKDAAPWPGVIVYGFFNASKANAFMKKCQEEEAKGMTYAPQSESEYDALAETDQDGYCLMQLPLTGYIVVKPSGSDPVKRELRGMMDIKVTCLAAKQIGTVTKTAKRKRKNEPQIPNMCGNRMVVGPFYYYLSADDTDDKSRIIVSPVVKAIPISEEVNLDENEEEGNGEVVGHLVPFVKDGEQFQKGNLRRMGFDETRDPLFKYREGTFMHSHVEDSMLIHFVLEPVDRNTRYRVDALQAYGMNSNIPYRQDSVCLSEGYVKDPMRFLDYSLIELPINRERYARRGRAEFSKDHEKLDLKFVVGEARLDPTDTLNFKQMNQLKDNMSRYMGADAGITSAVIHGSASPEGGNAINARLCRERAEYLRDELSRFPALQDARRTGEIKTTHKVATWTDVANLLEADSLKEEAASVRAVLSTTKDMGRQEAAIRKLPCWSIIEQQILPQLRIVDIEYQYYTNRVKTREEIWELYQTDPGYRAGQKQVPYEFYELLGMIKDPKEKETIARAAYTSVKDEDGLRQWPLAAYELARCYAQRGVADTNLLKPYIDVQLNLEYHKQKMDDFGNASWQGWYNDEAIVTSHIKMLANAGAFASAYRVAEMLLPDGKPEYRRLKMFLRCLNCEWNDPEVMDTVSNSSYWNKIVVLAAQEDPGCWGTALYMLEDATQVSPADPRALYLKAQLRFNLDAPKRTTTGYMDDNFMFDEFFEPSADDPTVNSFGDKRIDWGLPMVQCCLKDERNLKYMLNDGTFNKEYRKAFKKYWKKLKADPEQCRKILTDLEKSAAPQQAAQPAIPGDAENGGATTGEQDIGTGDAPTTTSSAEAASGTEIQTNSADTASPPAIPVQQPAATPMEE